MTNVETSDPFAAAVGDKLITLLLNLASAARVAYQVLAHVEAGSLRHQLNNAGILSQKLLATLVTGILAVHILHLIPT